MIYKEIIRLLKKAIAEFSYDSAIAKINQAYEDNGFSAYEIREQDYDRTARDKNGICFNFALFLSKELDSLGIDNRCAILHGNGQPHMVVLYKDNSAIFVADISNAILGISKFAKKYGVDFQPDVMLPFFARRTIEDYMSQDEYAECLIVQPFIKNGKPIQVKPLISDDFYSSKRVGYKPYFGINTKSFKLNVENTPISLEEHPIINTLIVSFIKSGKEYRLFSSNIRTELQIRESGSKITQLMTDNFDFEIFIKEMQNLSPVELEKCKDIILRLPSIFEKQNALINESDYRK